MSSPCVAEALERRTLFNADPIIGPPEVGVDIPPSLDVSQVGDQTILTIVVEGVGRKKAPDVYQQVAIGGGL